VNLKRYIQTENKIKVLGQRIQNIQTVILNKMKYKSLKILIIKRIK